MPAMPVALPDLIARHGLPTPEAQMTSAAQHRDWDQLLTLSQQHPEISPAVTLRLLAEHVGVSFLEMRTSTSRRWQHDPERRWSPHYLESWVVGLLEQGLSPETSVKGDCRQATGDRQVTWSGPLAAMAVAMNMPQVLAWLHTHAPGHWETLPVMLEDQPSTLLHLAVRLQRWDLAQSLVTNGFSPHAPDGRGRLPWEILGPATEADQKNVMDTLGMWPRSPEEMAEGWKRRGLAAGHDRRLDQMFRMAMADHVGQGTVISREMLVKDFLDPRRGSRITDKTWALWKATTPEERQQVHDVKAIKLPGKWSLNQAAMFMAACVGLESNWKPVPPGTSITYENGHTFKRPTEHLVCHVEAWPTIAVRMTAAELDAPILTKKLSGQGITLTARGLRALAHWEWAGRNHWGGSLNESECAESTHWPAITAQEVRGAMDALQVMRPVVSLDRLNKMDTLLANMILPRNMAAITPSEQAWVDQLHATFSLPDLLALQARLWHQRPANHADGTKFIPGLALTRLLLEAPPASEPWPEAVRQCMPNVWTGLTAGLIGGSTFWSDAATQYEAVLDQIKKRGQFLEPLRQWGFEPTEAQWEKVHTCLKEKFQSQEPALWARLEAENRAWQAEHMNPPEPERRRSRLRA
jgi:hypothetical protein